MKTHARSFIHSSHPINTARRNFHLNIAGAKKLLLKVYQNHWDGQSLSIAFTENQIRAVLRHQNTNSRSGKINFITHFICAGIMLICLIGVLPLIAIHTARARFRQASQLVHKSIYYYLHALLCITRPASVIISSNFGICTSPIILICRRLKIDLTYIPHSRTSVYYKRYRHNQVYLYKEDFPAPKIFTHCEVKLVDCVFKQSQQLGDVQVDRKTVVVFLNLLDEEQLINDLIRTLSERNEIHLVKKHPRDRRTFLNEIKIHDNVEIAMRYERFLVSNSSVYFDLKDLGKAPYFYNLGSLKPIYDFDMKIEELDDFFEKR
jgi:hypothetical protein